VAKVIVTILRLKQKPKTKYKWGFPGCVGKAAKLMTELDQNAKRCRERRSRGDDRHVHVQDGTKN